MSSGLNNDVHTLTGAYVLDALSELERRAFEDHMAGCPACTQEVAELRETAARLGLAASTVPPPDLWNRVRTATTQIRQLPPISPDPVVIRPKRWPLRVAVFAAAASLLGAAAVGVGWITSNQDLHDQLAQSQNQVTQLQDILSAPDAHISSGDVGDGNVTAVASKSRDEMVVLVRGLPKLPSGRVYQAWFIKGGNPIPGQTLAASNGSIASTLSAAQGAEKLAFTLEPTGGSAKPSRAPLASMPMPA
ncbi:anti-sigma factor [Kibdelosporangium lantanae]